MSCFSLATFKLFLFFILIFSSFIIICMRWLSLSLSFFFFLFIEPLKLKPSKYMTLDKCGKFSFIISKKIFFSRIKLFFLFSRTQWHDLLILPHEILRLYSFSFYLFYVLQMVLFPLDSLLSYFHPVEACSVYIFISDMAFLSCQISTWYL